MSFRTLPNAITNLYMYCNSLVRTNNYVKGISILLFLAIAIIPAVLAILFVPIHPDSGYYLSIIEEVSKGNDPYYDISFGYTPIVIYLGVIMKKIFSLGLFYEPYLIVHFTIQFLTAILVYKICNKITNDKKYSFIASILFILMSHWNEGNGFLLETPSLFFGLLSIYLLISKEQTMKILILIGILTSMSYLSKQYGLGFIILVLTYYTFKKIELKKVLITILGFSIPILICLVIWKKSFIPILYGGGYGSNYEIIERLSGYYSSFNKLVFSIIPALPIAFILNIFILKKINDKDINILLLLGILGFMMQFIIAPFTHYYLYVIPFAIIYVFYILKRNQKSNTFLSLFVLITLLISTHNTYRKVIYRSYIKKSEQRHEQHLLAKQIREKIKKNDKLYIMEGSLMPQYFLTGIRPPNLNTIGYSFGIALTPKTHLKQLMDADYILKYKESYDYFDLKSKESISLIKKKDKISLNNEVELLN